MKNAWLFFATIVCLGCSHNPKPIDVKIGLAANNRSLRISGFDKQIIAEIGRDTSNEAWESLVPVYKMPGDTDMKDYQNIQPGNYQLADSVVLFTPDTAFLKGQTYFLRYFRHDESGSAMQYIRNKKRLGTLSHKDLVFSF